MRRLKYLFLIIPIGVAALTAWYLRTPDGEEGSEDPDRPRILLRPGEAHVVGLNLVEQAGGHTLWSLVAAQAKRGADGGIRIREPRLTLYREEGEPIWLTAGEGVVNEENRQMRFQKGVVATTFLKDGREARLTAGEGVVNGRTRQMEFLAGVEVAAQDGQRLTTPALGLDPSSRTLSTDHPFQWQGPGLTLQGQGLRLNLTDKTLLVEHGVKARFEPEEGGRL